MGRTERLMVGLERGLGALAVGAWILALSSVLVVGVSIGGRIATFGLAVGMVLMFIGLHRALRGLTVSTMLIWAAGLVVVSSLIPLLREDRARYREIYEVIDRCLDQRLPEDCSRAREVCGALKVLQIDPPRECAEILAEGNNGSR
jgi:hypothetical protein